MNFWKLPHLTYDSGRVLSVSHVFVADNGAVVLHETLPHGLQLPAIHRSSPSVHLPLLPSAVTPPSTLKPSDNCPCVDILTNAHQVCMSHEHNTSSSYYCICWPLMQCRLLSQLSCCHPSIYDQLLMHDSGHLFRLFTLHIHSYVKPSSPPFSFLLHSLLPIIPWTPSSFSTTALPSHLEHCHNRWNVVLAIGADVLPG